MIGIPELSLVALVGTSGSGKSTFAARHFGPFEVVSSDYCRGLVSDDENDQSATKDAFELLGAIVAKRLSRGRLTVVDATNVGREGRKQIVDLARAHDVLPVAIVLDVPVAVAVERNAGRADRRDLGAHVVRRQHDQLRRSLRGLEREGFRTVHVLSGVEAIDSAQIVREKLRNDLRDQHGPFDVIGDVHGCLPELIALLGRLGYEITRDDRGPVDAAHPDGRTAVFVGDLVDRGPDSPGVLRLVMGMAAAGHAHAVSGNHEAKLVRALRGRQVQVSHGLETTLAQLDAVPDDERRAVLDWCDGLLAHLVLDDGRLVVAHAGLKEEYHGRASSRVRSFALYGDTTGETDEFGLPVRYPWAQDYRGRATVLYGHTPTPEPEWVNNTMCLDTGAVFGGRLTALRYPEREVVQVDAEQIWYEPARPFPVAADVRADDDLAITDVLGSRVVETAHHGRVTVRAEQAAGALEVMSRFAQHPRWLPYLPPTMAPVATSPRPDFLEHPDEAFTAFAAVDVPRVVCEEKHMGSRAVVLVCADPAAAARRFGGEGGRTGAVYTRTGRAFLDDDLTEQLLARVRAAAAPLFAELGTDWLLLDAELLPWSLKADPLLRTQYAAVGAAAGLALPAALDVLSTAAARGLDVADLTARTGVRRANAEAYSAAYRRYRWDTDGLEGVQLAVFQVLAAEGATFHDRDHLWHLAVADRLVAADPDLFRATRRVVVDTADAGSTAEAAEWWTAMTAAGGEGMVVKPLTNLTRTRRGLVQAGLKVRGREYLRIIYGPDYTVAANLVRLKDRHLGLKRSLALREYALGLESLERLARGEPLWRIHEPVFAVLAMESDPVDPRL